MVNIDKIKTLAKEKGISIAFICKKLGFQRTYLNDVKLGKCSMSEEGLRITADILGTTPEYLKDESDDNGTSAEISTDVSEYLETVLQQRSLMFDGEPLDDESKELLLIAIKNSIEIAREKKRNRIEKNNI